MKTILIRTILFFIVVSAMIACQKEASSEIIENANNGNKLTGTWKFGSLSASTRVEESASDSTDTEKIISTSDYTSANNKGTVAFTTTDFTGTAISYDINGIVKAEDYINNVLEDTFSMPFNFSLPPTNSNGKYKLVGTDSLYFQGGFITIGLDSMDSKPVGFKYTLSGNKLTMKGKYINAYTEDDNGITVYIKQAADITVVLEK
ncbi:MAG: hypothetical protein HYX40_06520 [Sphingobacteriales bacterium]|nr:hypothetical protein [Sphingobacteriales bacterium]